MSNFVNEFEKRFSNEWFSSDWSEVKPKEEPGSKHLHKEIAELQVELIEIEERLEEINLKQLRLANLAKLYKIRQTVEKGS